MQVLRDKDRLAWHIRVVVKAREVIGLRWSEVIADSKRDLLSSLLDLPFLLGSLM